MTGMKWEDPPEPMGSGGRQSRWEEAAAELRANPQRWAVIREYDLSENTLRAAQQFAKRIRRGESAVFGPAGSFETATRQNKDAGTVKVYVRYVGDAS